MNSKEIIDLINIVEKSDLDEMHLEMSDFKLILKKNNKVSDKNNSFVVETVKETVKEKANEEEDLYIVKSPIVGVFYSSKNSGEDSYVNKGDRVKKGDILCIIEAMKLMNEIPSDVDGIIEEVLVSNEGVVEYGQPLFKIRRV